MDNETINSLQKDFPEMTQSVIGDVLGVYKGDKKAAAAALGGIDTETKNENEKKIKELQELFQLSKEICTQALVNANWNVDTAIVALFNRAEEMKQKSRKEKELESTKRREAEAKKQYEHLLEIFHTISKEKIQQLMDENEGDIEETTTQLLTLVAQQEEGKLKEKNAAKQEENKIQQELRLRELKIQALEEKFEDLSEKEVISALEGTDWDIKKAHFSLLTLSAEKKKNYLRSLFQSAKEEQIEAALEANNWDKVKAAQFLSELREKRTNSPVVKKIEPQTIEERSEVVAQELEERITASHIELEKNLKKESMAHFKKNLEDIIKVQARDGVSPGMAPPLSKQIDILVGNKPLPIEDVDLPSITQEDKKPMEEKPMEDKQLQEDNSKFHVILTAPENIDIGNQLVVNWEMTIGESTAYDWIGLYSINQSNKQYLTYQWRGKTDTKKGSITFTAPSIYGTYEFRYFNNNVFQHIAMSNKVIVGPKVELRASLDETGKKFVVNWTQLSGNKYPRAWIGLYEKSQKDNKLYLSYEYAVNEQISFIAPIKPKEYEFRFFTNSYEDIVRSNILRIEGEDRLLANIVDGIITVKPHVVSVDPSSDSVWLGLFFTSEKDNRQWRRYKYVTDRELEIQFKAPNTPGEYHVRMFANKTYDLVVDSNSFLVQKKI